MVNTNIVVSIIIATYNSGKTLNAALDSVLKQEYQDWECIVVDGASKDKTIDIIKAYVEKDSRFRYISEPDKGVYDAYNKGWKMAHGEWIHYLVSDDRLTPNGIADLMTMPYGNVELVSGHCYVEKIDGTIKCCISKGFQGCHQGKIVRRSTLERFNGFDQRYSILADADLNIRMEKAAIKIRNVDSYIAYFSISGVSNDIGGSLQRWRERYRIYKANELSNPLFLSAKISIRQILSIIYRKLKVKLYTNHIKSTIKIFA